MWRRFVAHLLPTGIFSSCSDIRSRRYSLCVRNQISSANAWLTTKRFRWFPRNTKIVWEIRSRLLELQRWSTHSFKMACAPKQVNELSRWITKIASDFFLFPNIHAASIFHALFHCLFFTWNEIIMRSLDLQRVCPHGPNIPFSIPTLRLFIIYQTMNNVYKNRRMLMRH